MFVRELEKKVASKEGPLGNRKFSDHKISAVLTSLRKVHHDLNSESLPMDHLLLELDILFDRKTFRHESIRMCISQLWSERLHTAYQTFEVLQAYQRNVREIGIDGLKLADEIVHYCDGKRESAIKLMDQLIATVK